MLIYFSKASVQNLLVEMMANKGMKDGLNMKPLFMSVDELEEIIEGYANVLQEDM
jgi:hypothetical protein